MHHFLYCRSDTRSCAAMICKAGSVQGQQRRNDQQGKHFQPGWPAARFLQRGLAHPFSSPPSLPLLRSLSPKPIYALSPTLQRNRLRRRKSDEATATSETAATTSTRNSRRCPTCRCCSWTTWICGGSDFSLTLQEPTAGITRFLSAA